MLRPSRRALVRVVLPVTALTLAAGAVAGFARHGAGAAAPAAASAAVDDSSTGEAAALLADVQDASGAPLPGRDPSMEVQTSLDDAASRSTLTSKPSKDAPGKGAHEMTAQEMANMDMGTTAERKAAGAKAAKKVLGDPKTTGVLSNGCATGYGQVTQCVPAHAPGGGVTTCAYVVTEFPRGIAVTGKDTLSLDADHDGVACDAGDLEHQH
jgi:hypothetical protein